MVEPVTLTAEEVQSTIVEGFGNNPNIFLNFINNPIPIAVVSNVGEDGYYYPAAFLSSPNGAMFGGFRLTSEGLTEKENSEFSKLLNSQAINNKTTIQLKDDNGNICKTINTRTAIVVATVKCGKLSYSIEKAQWGLEVHSIIELGDFKSKDHILLSAGSYTLLFKDELSRNRTIKDFNKHYEESYSIASKMLKRAVKESNDNA